MSAYKLYQMSSPSPYPYPSGTPSSPPLSFTPTPGPLSSVSPQVVVSYVHMISYSASPVGLPILYNKQKILSDISDDAFYGIICAIILVTLYTSFYAVYYYKKYKKERLRFKRLNEIYSKSSPNPAYQA
jgi:hypothetical protein